MARHFCVVRSDTNVSSIVRQQMIHNMNILKNILEPFQGKLKNVEMPFLIPRDYYHTDMFQHFFFVWVLGVEKGGDSSKNGG